VRHLAAIGVLASISWLTHAVWADEKVACATAAVTAQQQRADGKLREARLSLHLCAREVCPGLVRNDCTQWLAEVEASLPTIVLRASDARGQDVNDLKVSLDGQPFAERIDGLPLEVDPGPHVLTATRAGNKPVRQELTFYTNERNRTVSLLLEDVDPPPAGTGELKVAPDRAPKSVGPAPYVLGAVAVGALASWAYFGLTSNADYKHLDETCGPNRPGSDGRGTCQPDQTRPVKNEEIVADVSLGVAIVSAGISTWLLLKGSKLPATTALPSREIFASPTSGGASAFWLERF
jgi:hypothetical protein